MIFFYDEAGQVTTTWYVVVDEEVLEKQNNWIEFKGEIPEKDGYHTNIKVVDGEVIFEYEKIPLTEIEVLMKRIDDLEMLTLLGGDVL